MMSKQKRTLKQIATDMRAAGEMLIEGAAEIEAVATMLESVNLNALTALLGGGPAEAIPFLQQQTSLSESTPAEPRPRRKAGTKHQPQKLTKEQKTAMRERWNQMPESQRTDAQKMAWAQRYGVPVRVISLIVSTDMEAAKQRMLEARARIGHSRSGQTPQTRTSVN